MGMTTTAAQIVSIQTDAVLWEMFQATFGLQGALRDSNGNLRDFTAEEDAFRTALRAEVTRRNLTRAA
jgi:hypothetical protein